MDWIASLEEDLLQARAGNDGKVNEMVPDEVGKQISAVDKEVLMSKKRHIDLFRLIGSRT